MNKKKILIGLVVLLLGGGYVAKGYLMPPPVVHDKISGTIYVLPKQFTLNMRDGRYATLTAALVLAPGQSPGVVSETGGSPPEGFGTLPEEAAIRDIITNIVTNQNGRALTTALGRTRIKRQILTAIRTGTDVKVNEVLFTDVAVQ
jgi:Flagellar basal body-associated protein FliL